MYNFGFGAVKSTKKKCATPATTSVKKKAAKVAKQAKAVESAAVKVAKQAASLAKTPVKRKRKAAPKMEVIIAPSSSSTSKGWFRNAYGGSTASKSAIAPSITPKSVATKSTKKTAAKSTSAKKGRPKINDGLTSSQRSRKTKGVWKTFGTPKQASCTTAGRTLKKKATGAAGRRLASCKYV